jgi:hypothetical protein
LGDHRDAVAQGGCGDPDVVPARLAAGVDLFPGGDPCLGLEEVDMEAERYERSL